MPIQTFLKCDIKVTCDNCGAVGHGSFQSNSAQLRPEVDWHSVKSLEGWFLINTSRGRVLARCPKCEERTTKFR